MCVRVCGQARHLIASDCGAVAEDIRFYREIAFARGTSRYEDHHFVNE